MRLDTRAFGVAAGVTAGVVFSLCSLAVAIAPAPAAAFASYLVHMDLSGLPRTLTLRSFLGGLVAWTIGTGLTFAFAAWVYDRLIAAAHTEPTAASQQPATPHA
jgi:hypothetical protein